MQMLQARSDRQKGHDQAASAEAMLKSIQWKNLPDGLCDHADKDQ
jgi:hypothetical protein